MLRNYINRNSEINKASGWTQSLRSGERKNKSAIGLDRKYPDITLMDASWLHGGFSVMN